MAKKKRIHTQPTKYKQKAYLREHSYITYYSPQKLSAFARKNKRDYDYLKRLKYIPVKLEEQIKEHYIASESEKIEVPKRYRGKVTKANYFRSKLRLPFFYTKNVRLYEFDLAGYSDIDSLCKNITESIYLLVANKIVYFRLRYFLGKNEYFYTSLTANCPSKDSHFWLNKYLHDMLENLRSNYFEYYRKQENVQEEFGEDDMVLLYNHLWFYSIAKTKKRGLRGHRH